jgi:hypothetical protein
MTILAPPVNARYAITGMTTMRRFEINKRRLMVTKLSPGSIVKKK